MESFRRRASFPNTLSRASVRARWMAATRAAMTVWGGWSKMRARQSRRAAMSGKVSLLTTVSLSVLALCVSSATAADRNLPVAHARGTVHRVISAVPGAVTLYDQNDDDAGLGALSVNFNSDFDSFDSYGADDFAVPAGHKWKIRAVEVSGYYREDSEPARSENVLFYRSERGFPGRLIANAMK